MCMHMCECEWCVCVCMHECASECMAILTQAVRLPGLLGLHYCAYMLEAIPLGITSCLAPGLKLNST